MLPIIETNETQFLCFVSGFPGADGLKSQDNLYLHTYTSLLLSLATYINRT